MREKINPVCQRREIPHGAYARVRQESWILDWRLSIIEVEPLLPAKVQLELGASQDCVFRNDRAQVCRYVVGVCADQGERTNERIREALHGALSGVQRTRDRHLSADIFITHAVLGFALSNARMFEKLAVLSNVADSASDGVG